MLCCPSPGRGLWRVGAGPVACCSVLLTHRPHFHSGPSPRACLLRHVALRWPRARRYVEPLEREKTMTDALRLPAQLHRLFPWVTHSVRGGGRVGLPASGLEWNRDVAWLSGLRAARCETLGGWAGRTQQCTHLVPPQGPRGPVGPRPSLATVVQGAATLRDSGSGGMSWPRPGATWAYDSPPCLAEEAPSSPSAPPAGHTSVSRPGYFRLWRIRNGSGESGRGAIFEIG